MTNKGLHVAGITADTCMSLTSSKTPCFKYSFVIVHSTGYLRRCLRELWLYMHDTSGGSIYCHHNTRLQQVWLHGVSRCSLSVLFFVNLANTCSFYLGGYIFDPPLNTFSAI